MWAGPGGISASARRSRGFSLVELMVVVTIMGIFAAMAVPSFQRSLEQAKADGAAADLRSIWVAQRFHRLQTASHAADLAPLVAEGLLDPDINSAGRAYAYLVTLNAFDPGLYTVSAVRNQGPAAGQGFWIDQDGRIEGAILYRGQLIRPGYQFGAY